MDTMKAISMSPRGSTFLRCAGPGYPKDVGGLHAVWIYRGDGDEHNQRVRQTHSANRET